MMEKNEILGRENMKKHNSTSMCVCRVEVGGRKKNREGKRKKEGGRRMEEGERNAAFYS